MSTIAAKPKTASASLWSLSRKLRGKASSFARSGLRAQGSGLRAQGSGLRAQGSYYTLLNRRRVKYLTPETPRFYQDKPLGLSIFFCSGQNTLFSCQNTAKSQDFAPESLDFASKSLDFAPESLDFASKSLDFDLESLDFAPKSLENTALWGYAIIDCRGGTHYG
jgi:hypothetical protein